MPINKPNNCTPAQVVAQAALAEANQKLSKSGDIIHGSPLFYWPNGSINFRFWGTPQMTRDATTGGIISLQAALNLGIEANTVNDGGGATLLFNNKDLGQPLSYVGRVGCAWLDKTNGIAVIVFCVRTGTTDTYANIPVLTIDGKGKLQLVLTPTASAPAYTEGALYYDSTLHKLRVGGAADWETVTSV
jgi:hypothetical protein